MVQLQACRLRREVARRSYELLSLYKDAIRRQLISDAGGAASKRRHRFGLFFDESQRKSWPTYTGICATFADDELGDAAETARLLGSKHASITITRSIFEEALAKIVAALEEPIAASSIVPMYFVCQRARQDVKVALVGQGPDELFGGYRRHLGVRYGAMWARLPAWMRAPISSTVAALPRNETLKRGVNSLAIPDRMRRYQNVLSLCRRAGR
jgi:asparagine synthase (glutamine-hydrolysing)